MMLCNHCGQVHDEDRQCPTLCGICHTRHYDGECPINVAGQILERTLFQPKPKPDAVPVPLSFGSILDDMLTMYGRKRADYGSASDPVANLRAAREFGIQPWVGAVLRLNDKMTRIKSFVEKGNLMNESVDDNLLDIAVYGALALLLYRESLTKGGVE